MSDHPSTPLKPRRRVLITVIVGFMFFILSAWVGILGARDSVPQKVSRNRLEAIAAPIAKYKSKTGKYPPSLDEIARLDQIFFQANEQGQRLDGWGNPIQYNPETGVVMTFGRDGKPGGRGLDFDYSTANYKSQAGSATLGQVLQVAPIWCFLLSSLCIGAAGSWWCWRLLREKQVNLKFKVQFILYLLLLMVAAFYVSALITILQLPNGR